MFNIAIVRNPSESFADGLTSVDLGVPDLGTAVGQHRGYCEALVRCGLEVIELEADAEFPDSVFVEDTAVLTGRCLLADRAEVSNTVTAVSDTFS